jgi:hypothetical protein
LQISGSSQAGEHLQYRHDDAAAVVVAVAEPPGLLVVVGFDTVVDVAALAVVVGLTTDIVMPLGSPAIL